MSEAPATSPASSPAPAPAAAPAAPAASESSGKATRGPKMTERRERPAREARNPRTPSKIEERAQILKKKDEAPASSSSSSSSSSAPQKEQKQEARAQIDEKLEDLPAQRQETKAEVDDTDEKTWVEPARRRVAEAEQRADKAEREAQRQIAAVKDVHRKSLTQERTIAFLKQAIESAGFEVDAQALELHERKARDEVDKLLDQQMQQQRSAYEKQIAEKEFEAIVKDIGDQAKRYGVDPKKLRIELGLAQREHLARELPGDPPSAQDVAKKMRAASQQQQTATSNAAPSLVRQQSVSSPTIPKDRTLPGRERFLKSRGHDAN